jgi:two-component system NtrC family sensor kinase
MQSVLIVDDNAQNLYLLDVLLKGNDFVVRSACNGALALESALKDPPDLILTDILMPVMDGYTLCRKWRANDRLKGIPFIFYTATYTEPKDEALALSLGADRFVIKPQEPEVLMGIIREVLAGGGRETKTPADAPREEGELLKEYNEVLFHKLEKKMSDLERAYHALEHSLVEQKRLEEQLRQVQKLEAVGRFSAGIAHDFNNILTAIVGFGDLLRLAVTDQSPQREMVNQILAAADRAQNLTRSLLAFSRKQEPKLQPLNLNDCIRNTESFLQRIIGRDIRLITALKQDDIPIVADVGHIEQVLMNLVANACDAMPYGGVLTIGTDILAIDDEFIRLHGYGAPGRSAVLSISDNGVGMDSATRQRIFEPFFTTKENDKGTGLGLSIVYGIVQQHQGHISVYSEPGQGTTFKILLPLLVGDASYRAAGARAQPPQGGTETILVVDDEMPIRRYLELFLPSLGYTVLSAQDGQEAVDIIREKGHQVDLVLMDVILPRKSGKEAAAAIRGLKDGLKIVFVSGYSAELVLERSLLDKGEILLTKPLSPTALAGTVRAVLDGQSVS